MLIKRLRSYAVLSGLALLPALLPCAAGAQAPDPAAATQQTQRVSRDASLAERTTLPGHKPGWALAENDLGSVPDSTVLHLQILLSRAPQVQAAFEQRLADQQNRTSPLFHHWLTPAQIGQLYGLVPSDVEAVTSWLHASGLHVDAVTPSGNFVQVSGSAAAVASTFQTALHQYRLPSTAGEKTAHTFRAPVDEPTIPSALLPVISAIGNLAETPANPQSYARPADVPSPQPLLTSATGMHYLAPADFATIYDLNPLYNAGKTGTGYRVAVIGESQVNPNDVSTFEAAFNLPARAVNVVIPTLGADPGQTNDGAQSEASLDVERVLGTAPGAQADLIVSSAATGGNLTAISYNVQTLLDPIMTISFGGGCEVNFGKPATLLIANLFAQAAAEGISTFVSGGDAGVNSCQTHGAPPAMLTQTSGINAYCASGFVTCVGGTEFADTSNPSVYWNASNGTNRGSAIGYIPEGAWSDPYNANTMTYTVLAGGGGASIYFPKPAFQTGTGVPLPNARYTPDISFSASASHDGYVFCYTNLGTGCSLDSSGNFSAFYLNGGTSATAPSMAGIAAIIDQTLGGPQGNLNPLIYRLANSSYSSAFHDATPTSSGVPAANCTVTIANMCSNSLPSATSLMGGDQGFLLTTGFDEATGWGSLDVANFLAAAVKAGAPSTATLSGSSGAFAPQQALTFNVAIAAASGGAVPTGTVQFFANGFPSGTAVTLSSTGQASYNVSSTMLGSALPVPPFGPVQVTAVYSGDSTFEGSTSNGLSLTLNPKGNVPDTLTLTATPSSTSPTQTVTITATLASTGSTDIPTGVLSIYAVDGGFLSLVRFPQLSSNQYTFNLIGLNAGTHTYIATYPGDSTYAPASSAKLTIVSAPLPTSTTVAPATANTMTPTALAATVSGVYGGTASGSTTVIRFFDGSTFLGASMPVYPATPTTGTTSGTATLSVTLAAGTHSITAVWPGDSDSSMSTSPVVSVVSVAPGLTYSAATPTITASAGAAASDVVTLTSVGGYSGPANLSCTATYNGTQTVMFAPSCSFSTGTLTLAAGGTATSTLSITTVAPHVVASPGRSLAGAGLPEGDGKQMLALAAVFLAPLLFKGRHRRSMPQLWSLLLLAGCGSLLMVCAGCGSHPAPVGTTTGSYTVTVSGGTGTTSAVLGTIGLTVQ